MDEAIQAADPDRWERFMLRQRQEDTGRQRGAQVQRGAEPAGAEEEKTMGGMRSSRATMKTTPDRKTQAPSNPFQPLVVVSEIRVRMGREALGSWLSA